MREHDLKILWISDIHFSTEYSKLFPVSRLADYLNDFRDKIKKSLSTGQYDYIFLTGDLAQAGTTADYELFLKEFLAPLLDIFLKYGQCMPKVLTIPGNHDVNWGIVLDEKAATSPDAQFLRDYLNNIIPSAGQDNDRADYLGKNEAPFMTLFNDYQAFITKTSIETEGGKYKDFFVLEPSSELEISKKYRDTRLHGHIVDHRRRVIMVFLNTAWYSLGGGFNELYAELEYKRYEQDETRPPLTKSDIKNWLKIKDYIREYNNQVTGINIFEYDDLKELIKRYKDYFVVTTMHHPLNWLKWSELYNYQTDQPGSSAAIKSCADKLNDVLDNSNLVLSGHEHIPKNIRGALISINRLDLKSGCFLFDDQHKKLDLSYSWFSVLKINTEKAFVEQDKHYYNNEPTAENWEVMYSKDEDIYPIKKLNDNYDIDPKRYESIRDLMASTTTSNLIAFLQSRHGPGPDSGDVSQVRTKMEDIFSAFLVQCAGGPELCLVARQKGIYHKLAADAFYGIADQLMKEQNYLVKKIRILVLDFFIDPPTGSPMQQLSVPGENREQTLNRIAGRADSLFNIFRHQFYARFEGKLDKPDMKKKFLHYRDMNFINDIVPYYICEKYWRRL